MESNLSAHPTLANGPRCCRQRQPKLLKNAVLVSICLVGTIGALSGCSSEPTRTAVAFAWPVSFSGSYFKVADVDVAPSVIRMVPPEYPAQWKARGVAGNAVIDFIIDVNGAASQVQCKRATDEAFAKAAIAAVIQWRYIPAKKGGHAVACAVEQELTFGIWSRTMKSPQPFCGTSG